MPQPSHTLMFIDDDEHFVYLLKRLTRKIGSVQNVMTAAHGESAIEILRQLLAEKTGVPTIIFVDVNMPVMNGHEFLKAFQALSVEHPELKSIVHIVMLTSSNDQRDRDLAMGTGIVSDYLVKQSAAEMKKDIERILVAI